KSLVMIETERGVVARPHLLGEQAVGWPGTGGVDAAVPQGADGRLDDQSLFLADGPGLAGVGIEARHREPWRRDPEIAAQGLGGHETGVDDLLERQRRRHLG